MSRDAYERVVGRVMADPAVRAKGVTEDQARKMAARATERAEREPRRTPLTQEQLEERGKNVKPYVRTARAPIDKGSEAHHFLSHADGTAPPRVAFHERVTDEDRRGIAEAQRRTDQRLKEMLERG